MEPLTAFGLAASIVQFVNFATTLIKKGSEIHDSLAGLSQDLEIDETYEHLNRFSSTLEEGCSIEISTADPMIRDSISSLSTLAKACKSDCSTLLEIIHSLKVQGGPKRRVRSLKAAFAAMRKEDVIDQLKERLTRTEAQITVHLCRISKHHLERHTKFLEQLAARAYALEVDQRASFDALALKLDEIRALITTEFKIMPDHSEVEAMRDRLTALRLAEQDITREQSILCSLSFEHRLDRYESISRAHQATLSWIFHPENGPSQGKRLLEWLRCGQGIFWVTGKPGSGKSTLMRFLADNPQTHAALAEWAGSKPVFISSHYFWWSGNPLQKSQEGLFRTLLHGVFQRCPSLIQKICPDLWQRSEEGYGGQRENWTLDELLAVFSSITTHPELAVKFLICIDGLDEYQGDHIEICSTLCELGLVSNDIKICVSSRPWNDFQKAFGCTDQVIRVHELTEMDIRKYTQARIFEHWAWESLSGDIAQTGCLVDLITRRAEGVFLWVFLVTKEVREGMSNHDSLSDLYRRVKGFPPDLEQFFKHILSSVNPFYGPKMSSALQTAVAVEEPLELSIYAFQEQEFDNSRYALDLPVGQFPEVVVNKRLKKIEKRLNGWCKGLLEVHHGTEVHFLHRTVRDFLKTQEMGHFLESKSPKGFCVGLSIVKAFTAWVKSCSFHGFANSPCQPDLCEDRPVQWKEPLRWMVCGLLKAASDLDGYSGAAPGVQRAVSVHIDAFEEAIRQRETIEALEFADPFGSEQSVRLLRSHVFTSGLSYYLRKKLSKTPDYLKPVTDQPLEALLDVWCSNKKGHGSFPGLSDTQCRDTLRCLLETGEDPNASVSAMSPTPFSKLLGLLNTEEPGKLQEAWPVIHNRIVSLFLEFGADPNTLVYCYPEGGQRAGGACHIMLSLAFNIEADAVVENAYLLELDSVFEYGGNPEAKEAWPNSALQPALLESGRDFFFSKLEKAGRDNSFNRYLVSEVAKRLLRRIQDQAELKTAWAVLNETLPRAICLRMRGNVAGKKRKRH